MWAVDVLREVGKPVAVTMCIGPEGDMHDVTPGECAVRLAQAGKVALAEVGGAEAAYKMLQSLKNKKETFLSINPRVAHLQASF